MDLSTAIAPTSDAFGYVARSATLDGIAEDPPAYGTEPASDDSHPDIPGAEDGTTDAACRNACERAAELKRLRLAADLLRGLDQTAADRDERSRRLRARISGLAGHEPLDLESEPAALRRRIQRLARAAERDLAEQLELLVRFDERELFRLDGCRDMVVWMDVHLRLGRTMGAERLRVGRALRELPVLGALFALGQISFSQLRIVTRYATPANDAEFAAAIVELSVAETIEYCERFRHDNDAAEDRETAARDGADAAEACAALRAYERRLLTVRRLDAHRTRIVIELPRDSAAEFVASLEQAEDWLRDGGESDECEGESTEPGKSDTDADADATPAPTARQRRADAAVLMSRRSLAHAGEAVAMADRYRVHVHLDARLLADDARDLPGLAPLERPSLAGVGPIARATARRLAEAAGFTLIAEDGDGEPVGTRRVRAKPFTERQLRAIRARDRGCQVPGCGATRHLDGHHVVHREHGGASTLDNAALICGGCHRLLHEGGFRLERAADGEPAPGNHARQAADKLDAAARRRVRERLAKVRRFRLFDAHGRECGSIGAAREAAASYTRVYEAAVPTGGG